MKFAVLLLAFFTISIGFCQTRPEKIDSLMNYCYKNRIFNGCALIADSDNIIFSKSYGYANMEWKIPHSNSSKFKIGALTQTFTAALVQYFIKMDSIDIDDKICDHLPKIPKDKFKAITIRNLLSHSSGLFDYTYVHTYNHMKMLEVNPVDYCLMPYQYDLQFGPGTKSEFSNSNYYLLGVLIEKISGLSYSEALDQYILKRYDLRNTGYFSNTKLIQNRAYGYDQSPLHRSVPEYANNSQAYSSFGMYSDVEDLFKWSQIIHTDTLFCKLLKERPQSLSMSYSFGWEVTNDTSESATIISKRGEFNGYDALFIRFVEDNQVIILLNNTGATNLKEIGTTIRKILQNKGFNLPKISITIPLIRELEEHSIKNALRKYEKLKKDSASYFKMDVNELNDLASDLLEKNEVENAIQFLELNLKEYPQSSEVYVNLGKAWVKAGDPDKSISFFKESLEIYSGNVRAIQMLKKLMYNSKALKIDVKVSSNILLSYEGRYELSPDVTITVTSIDEHLNVEITGYNSCKLSAYSETHFYSKDFIHKTEYAEISFNKDPFGKVTSLSLNQNQEIFNARKIIDNE